MKISVIIPCYNSRDVIADALNSVFAQQYDDLEVIVVDDGSSEDVSDILEKYGPKVKLIRQQNAGPAAARNTGIKNATGELIAFIDSDDIWLDEKLKKQTAVFQSKPVFGMVFCDGYKWDGVRNPAQCDRLSQLYARSPAEPGLDLMFKVHMVPTSSVLFRRDLLQKTGLIDEKLRGGEDYEFFLRLRAAAPAYYIDQPLMAYRCHEGNTSSTVTRENVKVRIWRKLNARHAALASIGQLKKYKAVSFFAAMPPLLQYSILLFWRFRYSGSKNFTLKSILRYAGKLMPGKKGK